MTGNLKKIILPGLLLGSIAGWFFRSQTNSTASKTTQKRNPYAGLEAYIQAKQRQFNIPGISMAIVERDRVVHYRGFGTSHPGGAAPGLLTPFFVGSVTKSVTAMAIMQLVEAGRLALDAPVQRYLPWFRVEDEEDSRRISIRHLLNHTSGLSMIQGQEILADLDDRPGAAERQLRALSTRKLAHPVGAKFAYNNTNYNLLGLIVEAASSQTYTDYIQKYIFDPLDMHHSWFSKSIAQQNGLAMGHRYWFGFPIPEPGLPQPMGSLASGQLISCAEDMCHYLVALLNGGRYGDVQIISSEGIDEMQRGTAEIIVMGKLLGYYGMGWESIGSGESRIVSHSGIVPEYGAFAALVPGQKKGIILMYNANHALVKLTFDEFGMGAAERLAGVVPSKSMFAWMPWLMHGMLLVPVLQVAGVVATLRKVRLWRAHPEIRPGRTRLWLQHILLPLLPNLAAASTLIPILGRMRGWVMLFMPDFSWVARICGTFAALWSLVRTGLILKNTRLHQSRDEL